MHCFKVGLTKTKLINKSKRHIDIKYAFFINQPKLIKYINLKKVDFKMTNKIPEWITSQMELPIITAPMFLVSSPEMVVAGCKGGIIGSFPLANARTKEDLENWMSRISEELTTAKQLEPNRKIAPWAVNLVVHRTNKRYEEDLTLIKKYQPPIVITSLGDPSEVVRIVHDYGGLVFSDVINLVHAKKAAKRGQMD